MLESFSSEWSCELPFASVIGATAFSSFSSDSAPMSRSFPEITDLSDLDFDEGSSSEDGKVVAPVKKRRIRINRKKYPVSPFPRIVKRDIRRAFPRMMANLFNDGSVHLVYSFFQTYAVSNMVYEEYRQNLTTNQLELQAFPPFLSGLEAVMMTIGCNMTLSPDRICKLERSFIRQRILNSSSSDFESEIVIEMYGAGTRLFDFAPLPHNCLVELAETSSGFLDLDKMLSQQNLVLRDKPTTFTTVCLLTLRLDENNRIKTMFGQVKHDERGLYQERFGVANDVCLPLSYILEKTFGIV